MKKVLIVSYVFPPMAAVGGQRVLNFCKFLPRFEWTPVVLTVKKGVNMSWDYSLLDEIGGIKVYRSRSFEPLIRHDLKKEQRRGSIKAGPVTGDESKRDLTLIRRVIRFIRYFLTVPDFAIFWIPFGVLKGLKAIRKEKISVIVSSSPPVSSHIIASILSRLTGLPHLADFRDLWTLNHVYHENNYPPYIVRYDRFWERFVLKGVDRVVTASPDFTDQMKSNFEEILQNRTATITNGFDYSEVDTGQKNDAVNDGTMRFVYAGSLYSHFNPVFFLECLSEWLKNSDVGENRVRVDFYGNCDFDYTDLIRKLELGNNVYFHGFKSRRTLLPLLCQADCLLLFLGFDRACSGVIPAKLFEYLAAEVPILALAPDGAATDIISGYRAGYAISEPDNNAMKGLIDKLYREWSGKKTISRGFRYIEEIDRINLTGRLAGLLDQLRADGQAEGLSGLRHKVP